MLLCSISGQVPQEPVVAVKTGLLYERRLIGKAIQAEGKCPVSGTLLTIEDLAPLKASPVPAPRAPEGASVAGLLAKFQAEWDALMLETFKLRQQLQTTRTELAQSLYQHDAACRVIARLTKERDEAREMLGSSAAASATTAATSNGSSVQGKSAATGGSASGAEDTEMGGSDGPSGLSATHTEAMKATSKQLSKVRKKMKKNPPAEPFDLGTMAEKWTRTSHHTLHKTTQPGIACIKASARTDDVGLVATGGVDGDAKLFDHADGKLRCTLKAHKKQINSIALHSTEPIVVTASADRTARVWTGTSDDDSAQATQFSSVHLFEHHTDSVVACSVHPTGDLVATTSTDKTWALLDIREGRCLTHTKASPASYACGDFHPDGLLFVVGASDNKLQVWDVMSSTLATELVVAAGVTCVAFSENGYYMATGGADASATLWDLRKITTPEQVVHSFVDLSGPVTGLSFDRTGHMLATAHGSAVTVNAVNRDGFVKLWSEDNAHKKPCTGVQFACDSSFLASSGMDRGLNFYAMAS